MYVNDLAWCLDRRLLAALSRWQPTQRGPLARSGKSNEFASQIRRVQFIRFRVIWRVTEFVAKSLIFDDAQSNEFRPPAPDPASDASSPRTSSQTGHMQFALEVAAGRFRRSRAKDVFSGFAAPAQTTRSHPSEP